MASDGPVRNNWQHDLLRDLGGGAMTPGTGGGPGTDGGSGADGARQAAGGPATAGGSAMPGPGHAADAISASASAPVDASVWDTPTTAKAAPGVPEQTGVPSAGPMPTAAHATPPGASGAPGPMPSSVPSAPVPPAPPAPAPHPGPGHAAPAPTPPAAAPHPAPPPQAAAATAPAPVHTPTPLHPPAPVRESAPARRSGPTPVSVPLMPPELDALRSKPRHGESVAQRAGRAVRRAIASSPAAETTAVTQTAYAIQQPVTTGRQISVTSIRGGAGKSTVSALLALTYAHYRADPVLAVEADPALGTLPHRLGATEVRWSGTDLAQIVDPSMLITDLTGYLIPFPGGGWLLPGSQGAIGTRLDIDTYRVVMTSLRRYFATTVVDCETLPAEVARTALVTTQARILVCPATPEGVAATRSVLDWVGGVHPRMLPTTVVVLSHVAPDTGLDVRKAAEHLGVGGAVVLPLPYDRHLAAGGAIRTELLGERTLQAAGRIAAEAMDRAVSRADGSSRQRTGQDAPPAPGGVGHPTPYAGPAGPGGPGPQATPGGPGPYGAPGPHGASSAAGGPTPYPSAAGGPAPYPHPSAHPSTHPSTHPGNPTPYGAPSAPLHPPGSPPR
ncbi:cobalamin biosynthesis protein CbiA [Streptomyces sioyaensis]|uniref:cobalamin biosynthesis protein CbiA n=1 Tax=Streptomyces sioyaensis TaxID=67364 RepID=UPI0033E9A159